MALFRDEGFAAVTVLDRTANARSKTPGAYVAVLEVRKAG